MRNNRNQSGWRPFRRIRRLGCLLMVLVFALPLCFFATIAGLALDININQNPQLAAYFPKPDNYGSTSIQPETVSWSISAAASLLGQPGMDRIADKVGAFIGCLQNTGAADVRVYLQRVNLFDLQIPPETGVVALLDQKQFAGSFTGCVRSAATARATEPEPCFGVGTFTQGGRTFYYVFASTHRGTGTLFDEHFKGTLAAQGTLTCFRTPE